MGKSVKDFVGVNSFNIRSDGTEMSHKEIFTTIVDAIGLGNCIPFIPATKEQIKKALKYDKHLNNIPLQEWDRAHLSFKYQFKRIGITSLSLSETVCTLKRAAVMWAEEE